MTPGDFREQIARPAIQAIGLWSQAAEDLLVATAVQESGLRNVSQAGGGPAKGYFQMEPATFYDIWDHYLAVRKPLADKVRALCDPDPPSVAELSGNPRFACAMARIKYLRVPEPLPAAGDLPAIAAYWKRFYNTPLGKGTEAEFVASNTTAGTFA